MLLQALPERIERFLDIGSGDGRLLALIRERHPGSWGIGIDASPPMLARATERFAHDPQVECAAHNLNDPMAVSGPLDAVVSGLAIHHLSHVRKRALFQEIHDLLIPGGVFANLDLVASATVEQHERFRREIGRPQDDPADQLAGLCDQLGWLREAGFRGVDCHFKWMELALLVAVRGE